LRETHLRAQILAPQFEQDLALAHAIAFAHQQARDLSAGGGCQLGAPAGGDRRGPGVGHRAFDRAALHGGERHGDRIRPRPEIDRRAGQDEGGEGEQPAGPKTHGTIVSSG